MSTNKPSLLSGRVPVTGYGNLSADRNEFLGLDQAEPNLGPGAANSVLTLDASNTRVWSNALSVTSVNATGNITAANFVGNITGNITVTGANTDVLFNNNGVVGASDAFKFDSNSNVMSVAGNVVAVRFQGDGSQLANVMTDRGSDQNDWNTLIQMGIYAVNRTSWSGTVGTPLDSQVFVGLLEVKNGSNLGIVQVYSPGTVDTNNIKIQWNRNYWNGTWTQWVRMTNDQQQIDGGGF